MFKVPELVSIPMSLPLLMELGNSDQKQLKAVHELYNQLDACNGSDLASID